MPKLSVHSLHHFHTALLPPERPEHRGGEQVGHSTVPMTTEIYSHSLPRRQRQAVEES